MARWLLLALLGVAAPALAQEAPPPEGALTVPLKPISQVPASFPRDVPVPQGAKPVAAVERPLGLVVLFLGVGKAEPMRAAYQEELPKRGWSIEGSDEIGEEQGLFAVQGERTLSLFFREHGKELRIQIAYVPRTPVTPPLAPLADPPKK